MYHSVGAVATAGASPIVRVAGCEPWMMKRALDSGAHGIMVPCVETKEQAELVARATHYRSEAYPLGIRGAGGLFAPANFHLSGRDYMTHANECVTVIVQIESLQGVANAAEIAAVPGIDMLFIGPNDLACSMGHFAFDHALIPEVQEAGEKVLAAAREAGKYAGYFCLSADEAAKRWKAGWDFVNCGADIVAIMAWMGIEMGRLKGMLAEKPDTNKIVEAANPMVKKEAEKALKNEVVVVEPAEKIEDQLQTTANPEVADASNVAES
jgi:4-hydroxy-2-oxoheptanedioate aldolase